MIIPFNDRTRAAMVVMRLRAERAQAGRTAHARAIAQFFRGIDAGLSTARALGIALREMEVRHAR